jgi:hypothetical protein
MEGDWKEPGWNTLDDLIREDYRLDGGRGQIGQEEVDLMRSSHARDLLLGRHDWRRKKSAREIFFFYLINVIVG